MSYSNSILLSTISFSPTESISLSQVTLSELGLQLETHVAEYILLFLECLQQN